MTQSGYVCAEMVILRIARAELHEMAETSDRVPTSAPDRYNASTIRCFIRWQLLEQLWEMALTEQQETVEALQASCW